MVAVTVAGNISGEATTPSGNIFGEAMRAAAMSSGFIRSSREPVLWLIQHLSERRDGSAQGSA